VGIVWSTTTRTRVSDATDVTFTVKCFNPLKLYPLSGNIFGKWFASYFWFIHEHLMKMWSLEANPIAVTTLLQTSGLHCCYYRIFKTNTNYFYAARISMLLAILSEIFIQIGHFFLRVMQENDTWMFFFWTQCTHLPTVIIIIDLISHHTMSHWTDNGNEPDLSCSSVFLVFFSSACLFFPCGRLSWLSVSFLVQDTHYRIVYRISLFELGP